LGGQRPGLLEENEVKEQSEAKVVRIGFTCGTFDLLHAGHVLMLAEAKSVCDHLIVGLQIDPSIDRSNKHRPVQTLEERKLQLDAIKYVDEIMTYNTEEDLHALLKLITPSIRIVGADHQGMSFTGDDLVIPIHFNRRDHDWSTSDLRNRVYQEEFRRRVLDGTDEPGTGYRNETWN
jgi:glycerol-3-phosphate cytidylyltransferase